MEEKYLALITAVIALLTAAINLMTRVLEKLEARHTTRRKRKR